MQMVKRMRRVVAVISAVTLASTPLLLSPTGAAVPGAPTAARAATPHIKATLTKKTIKVTGAKGLTAGRVDLTVKGKGVVEFATFKKGYDVDDFVADVGKFGAKNDVKALKRALKNTQILGGFTGGSSGSLVFPKPGSYTPFALGDRGVVTGKAITVRGPAHSKKLPRTDGTIIGKNGPSWGGSSHLPAKGSFLLKNKRNTGVPHFVALQQVAEGTTTDQVLEFLQTSDESTPPPAFLLPGSFETGSVSPGRSLTANYDLPPGQYVVMCFFPDPKMGGMPHALMGMLEMIHLM